MAHPLRPTAVMVATGLAAKHGCLVKAQPSADSSPKKKVVTGNSGSLNGGTESYKAIFYRNIPTHRPEKSALYMLYIAILRS